MSADLNINVNVRGAESIDSARQKTDQAKAAASDWRQTVTAVSSAYTAVRSAISDVIAVARGMASVVVAVDEQQRALTRLGGAYELVQRETRGVVSAEQAVRAQQALTEAGYRVTGEQLAAITRRAREYAQATGGEVPQAIDQMVDALRTGAAEGLGRFGIAVQQGQTRQVSFRQATEQLIATQRGVAPAAHTAGEALTAFSTVARDAGLSIARDIGNSIGYVENRFIQLRQLMRELADMRDTEQANARGQVRDQEGELRMQGRLANVRTLSGAGLSGDQIARLSIADRQRVAFAVRGGASLQSALAAFPQMRAQDEANLERQRVGGLENRALDEAFAPGGQPNPTGGGGGGGGGGENPLREAVHMVAELRRTAAAADMLDAVDDLIARHPGETANAWRRRLTLVGPSIQQAIQEDTASRQSARQMAATESQRQAEFTRAQNEDRSQRLERASVNARNAVAQGTLAANFATLGGAAQQRLREGRERTGQDITEEAIRTARAADDVGGQLQSTFARTQTLAQNFAGAVGSAFEGATQAFTNHIQALIQGRENIGQAMLGIAHEVSMGIAMRSLPLAIFELASGFAAQAATLGVPNPISVQHFASAAMFGGLAAGGFLVGGITGAGLSAMNAPSPSVGGGSDAGTRLSAPRAANDNAGGGNQTFVLNFQSALITREDAQDVVVRAAQGAFNRSARIEQISQLQRARAAA